MTVRIIGDRWIKTTVLYIWIMTVRIIGDRWIIIFVLYIWIMTVRIIGDRWIIRFVLYIWISSVQTFVVSRRVSPLLLGTLSTPPPTPHLS